jgi:DNA-binding FadR family transcriptional regulator
MVPLTSQGANFMTEPTDDAPERVFDTMLEHILTGVWPADGEVPSEAALARTFGVHRSTISRATGILRYLGLIAGPSGGQARVGNPQALAFARVAVTNAERAREANRQT